MYIYIFIYFILFFFNQKMLYFVHFCSVFLFACVFLSCCPYPHLYTRAFPSSCSICNMFDLAQDALSFSFSGLGANTNSF